MMYLDSVGRKTDRGADIRSVIDDITDKLAAMTKEERLSWFKRTMYAEPLNFINEIDGTSYIVRTFFKEEATENLYQKLERILTTRK